MGLGFFQGRASRARAPNAHVAAQRLSTAHTLVQPAGYDWILCATLKPGGRELPAVDLKPAPTVAPAPIESAAPIAMHQVEADLFAPVAALAPLGAGAALGSGVGLLWCMVGHGTKLLATQVMTANAIPVLDRPPSERRPA